MNLVILENALDNTAFALLLVTTLGYWVNLAFAGNFANWGTLGMGLANGTMAALLIARWVEGGYFPLSNLYESLCFLAWGITAVHLLAERLSASAWVGGVTAPVALGVTAFAALSLPPEMQQSAPLVPALKSNWLMMHVSVMMLSYAALLVGSLLAMAFLVVIRGQAVILRGSSVGTGAYRGQAVTLAVPAPVQGNTAVLTRPAVTLTPERLTLAETLDNLSYRVIGLGFPLLTVGIISGGVWANEAWGSYWSWDPKETWALITWLVFAAYLHARITRDWQGRRPAILATVGFGVVWVCYLGVNILGKGLHSYGWFL
ncbi:c-type cytochrome synthesis protein ABC-type transport system involved in cytochrome c biogenesis permease component-like protein [Gloeomargarita lithophora Alchichica-D10]|uniref:Cytochrome c biogenesis protein CcsA n=1 Tax=Gloeomargarita lithophora Alchichica-D10 TaxID=1188229 RepID=A0A1J0ADN4_9CYAN|nr:c-type cytochrome biogenesis protein CcsB [Gloeomargarita lithophora]APB34024.1 c-type cytochrome synthesis protein ABC-type transport system involved in cytochrome c biogenesis permease component-like protein [Gloeomargarita lithophora Alchichica-D10]